MYSDIFIFMNLNITIENEIKKYISSIPFSILDTENKNRFFICENEYRFNMVKEKLDNNIEIYMPTLCFITVGKKNITVAQSEGDENSIKKMYMIVKWIYENYNEEITKIQIEGFQDFTEFFKKKGVEGFYHSENWKNEKS